MHRIIGSLLITFVLTSSSWAQRVLYSSQAILQPYQGPAIRAIRPHGYFASKITIKYADGRSQAVPKDSIWGYEDGRGRLFRYYKRAFYQVLSSEGIVRYSILRPTGRGVANYRYFSQDYDSPLRWTKAKARRDSAQVSL